MGIKTAGTVKCGKIEMPGGGDIVIDGVSLVDEIEALSGLDATELGYLDGVTAGTVTASKAVVVDANKDVATIRHLTLSGNLVTGATTLAEADLAKIDGITNGTQAAGKAVVADANVNTGVSKVTELHIGATGAETQVTATAAELNILSGVTATAAELNQNCDLSANSETIIASGVVSVTKSHTAIDSTAGAGAVTLAAPDATMLGKVKTIEMTADGGDITLALTNVQGGSAATTATFADVNDTLVLVGGAAKWHVIGESGVVLS